MVREGDMVRGHGQLMKVGLIWERFACCVWFDSYGNPWRKWFDVGNLEPLAIAIGARSAWPESGYLDQIEAKREEQAISAERKAVRKAARKARRSNKLNRGVAA